MIPGDKVPRKNYLSINNAVGQKNPDLEADAIADVVKELSELKEMGVRSFINLESYLRWYKNVFGQIALELMIEECRESIKQKKSKELLEIVNRLAGMRQNHARYTGETTDFSVDDDSQILLPLPGITENFSELDVEDVQKIIAEYEKYFEDLDVDAIINAVEASKRIGIGEEGFVSFGEIAALVKSVEVRMADLVAEGKVDQEKADVIIDMAHEIDVVRFSTMTQEQQQEIIASLATLEFDEVRDVIIEINEREQPVLTGASLTLDEAGFISFERVTDTFGNDFSLFGKDFSPAPITENYAQPVQAPVSNPVQAHVPPVQTQVYTQPVQPAQDFAQQVEQQRQADQVRTQQQSNLLAQQAQAQAQALTLPPLQQNFVPLGMPGSKSEPTIAFTNPPAPTPFVTPAVVTQVVPNVIVPPTQGYNKTPQPAIQDIAQPEFPQPTVEPQPQLFVQPDPQVVQPTQQPQEQQQPQPFQDMADQPGQPPRTPEEIAQEPIVDKKLDLHDRKNEPDHDIKPDFDKDPNKCIGCNGGKGCCLKFGDLAPNQPASSIQPQLSETAVTLGVLGR